MYFIYDKNGRLQEVFVAGQKTKIAYDSSQPNKAIGFVNEDGQVQLVSEAVVIDPIAKARTIQSLKNFSKNVNTVSRSSLLAGGGEVSPMDDGGELTDDWNNNMYRQPAYWQEVLLEVNGYMMNDFYSSINPVARNCSVERTRCRDICGDIASKDAGYCALVGGAVALVSGPVGVFVAAACGAAVGKNGYDCKQSCESSFQCF
ncbi:hypothetical protein [Undibacterium sp. Xuan67W]|uniref:hypothetical protein n=1 Tax=Undibacterium sp. Xuan67W TaxID=3413057 RepID=UPI003BEFE0A5